jgi:hypothetical protein
MAELDAIIATSSRLERHVAGHLFQPQTISGSAKVHNGDTFQAYNNTFGECQISRTSQPHRRTWLTSALSVLSVDVAKEAFGLTSILYNADDACKQVCAGLIKYGGKSDQRLSIQDDIKSLRLVLDTLRFLFGDEDTMESAVWAALSDNMNKIISDCMDILADLNTWTETPGPDREVDQKGKAPEIKKQSVAEVEVLRNNMNYHRISLSLAIATANWYV